MVHDKIKQRKFNLHTLTTISNNKRILKNTLILYLRMLVMMGISLFTTRVVFQALGLDNMGIYNLVGGVISMLGFLNNSMSSATQRFLSFEIGKNNQQTLIKTFGLVLLIHCILAALIFLLCETLGLWFINEKLVIQPERMNAANWVYQVAIISSILGILKVPFTASIMSHEKMNIYAYFTFIDVIFKLIIVYALWYISGDNLIIYSILLLISGIFDFVITVFYSINKFTECRFKFSWDTETFKNIFSFTGWNLLGQATIIGNEQILNIMLNWFFGTIVNGARGLSQRINSVLAQFVYQFQAALNPPIVKSYAKGEIENTKLLISRGMKLSFLLMMILSYPFILNTEQILSIWLGESPIYTAWFTKLTIINTLLDTMTGPLVTGIQATGKIKRMQIITSLTLLFILPISYILLIIGIQPYWVMLANIFIAFITLYERVLIVEKQMNINKWFIIKKAIIPCYLAAVLSFLPPFLFHLESDVSSLINLLTTTLISLITTIGLGYLLALDNNEKLFVKGLVFKMILKFKINKLNEE